MMHRSFVIVFLWSFPLSAMYKTLELPQAVYDEVADNYLKEIEGREGIEIEEYEIIPDRVVRHKGLKEWLQRRCVDADRRLARTQTKEEYAQALSYVSKELRDLASILDFLHGYKIAPVSYLFTDNVEMLMVLGERQACGCYRQGEFLTNFEKSRATPLKPIPEEEFNTKERELYPATEKDEARKYDDWFLHSQRFAESVLARLESQEKQNDGKQE